MEEYVTWTTLYEYEVLRQDGAVARVVSPNIEQALEALDWNPHLCRFHILKDMPAIVLSKYEPNHFRGKNNDEIRTSQ